MDKEYMLKKVRARIDKLRQNYLGYVSNTSPDGREVSANYAAVQRSMIKRDICILSLIEQLLVTSKAVFIEDEDAVSGFEKLIGEDM